MVNEDTGEVIQLEEGNYTQLAYGENLAVKEGIILNVDPINMGNESSWGKGVTLHGVQEGDGYGWNGTEFKLDGEDDYISVNSGDTKFDNGLTFEFYRKMVRGIERLFYGNIEQRKGL